MLSLVCVTYLSSQTLEIIDEALCGLFKPEYVELQSQPNWNKDLHLKVDERTTLYVLN